MKAIRHANLFSIEKVECFFAFRLLEEFYILLSRSRTCRWHLPAVESIRRMADSHHIYRKPASCLSASQPVKPEQLN